MHPFDRSKSFNPPRETMLGKRQRAQLSEAKDMLTQIDTWRSAMATAPGFNMAEALATKQQLNQAIDQAKGNLDSLGEMGDMEALRLQMAMDRMSKMMATLSNILKKISDTASNITQNLK